MADLTSGEVESGIFLPGKGSMASLPLAGGRGLSGVRAGKTTKDGLLALALDGGLIALSMLVALNYGLIQAGALPLPSILGFQAAGICGFLLINSGYRDPARIDVPRSLYLTSAAVALSGLIVLLPALMPSWASVVGTEFMLGISLYLMLIWVLLFAGRILFANVMRRRSDGATARSTILVIRDGEGALEKGLQSGSRGANASQMSLAEFFDIHNYDQGGLQSVLRRRQKLYAKDIIFAVHWSSQEDFIKAMSLAAEYAVNVHFFPNDPETYLKNTVSLVDGVPVVTIARRPLSDFQSTLKRCFDLAGSLAIIIATLPLMVLIALAIKLDSKGPVLFRQIRHGYNNQPFQILKFRSMFPAPTSDTRVIQATFNDKRVTRVGRVLRKLSLDELPQIFNVFQGDMSLIGPRPHALAHHEQFCGLIDGYRHRHRVKPGITGWAQVRGFRGETDTLDKMIGRVDLDLHYIDNWSLSLDIKILLMTLAVGFIHKNAY